MKTIKNIWTNIQRTDLITYRGKDYIVINADAKGNRSGSHLIVKPA